MVMANDTRTRQPPSAFGHLLKRLRVAADQTQEELAERAGVSARLISDLERGAIHRPRRDTVQLLADGLRLTGSELEAFAALARGQSRASARSSPTELGRQRRALPLPPNPIVGRIKETAAAISLLHDPNVRLLTLTGPGGVGKTRLAIEVATRVRDAFPDGALFVDLAPVHNPGLVIPTIAHVLGLTASGEQSLRESLFAALGGKRLLLVLDNFEHVTAAATDIADLLGTCPQLSILTTSRALLCIRAEQEYRVEPLVLPDLHHLPSFDELARIPAVELFLNRGGAANRSFALTAGNARAVAEITVRLDGLPLAIELAAARVRVLPPSALLARLVRRLPLLTGGARDLPARLQAMRAAIDWSHDHLHTNEQHLFRRLAVFIGGFTLEAAEWVEGGGRREADPSPVSTAVRLPPAASVLDDLTALVDKSLLHTLDDAGGERRFGILETLREYGLERLAAAGEEAETRGRHAAWCLSLAERAEPELTGPQQALWLTRLDAEHDNLRAALGWMMEQGDAETAMRLCGALYSFWDLRGHFGEGRNWLEEALALGEGVPPAVRAKALFGTGAITYHQGDYIRMAVVNEESLALFRALGDTAGVASSLGNLGKMAQAQGEFQRATALKEEALALFRQTGDRIQISAMLNSLGLGAYDQGNYQRATVQLEEALTLARELGNRNSAANAITNLGNVALAQGKYGTAAALQEEAFELWRALGNKDGLAHSCENFALIAAARREPERAARLAGAAEALRKQIGAPGRLVDRDSNERQFANARAELGDVAFAAAWEEGGAMPLEEALEYALEGGRQIPAGDARVKRLDD